MMSSEDKYDTLEKIGHGSFGIIRKVRRKTDGFIMCRKEISYLRMSQKEREQLHAEFQILSHFRHPNIVAYYHREHLKLSQDLHLYMEYCGNGDLGRVIKELHVKGQHAQESFVWSIFSQLVMALYRCHYGVDPPDVGANVLGLAQSGGAPKVPAGAVTVLHRDLKPENVFLGEDNSVKLGDFGLSKMIKSHDFASTYVGTPFYMSPEICAAEKYTLKSDIWSLGCIMYELCAREPPFNAKTHFQLVQKIKEGRVPALPDMYSPELGQVIRDCLRVNPERRPDTAQLLNLPVVRLMRKEKEVVDLNKALRRRERDLDERRAALDRQRGELDALLRRDWELKARLEIDRLANAKLERLQRRFEDEVRARVDAELERREPGAGPGPLPLPYAPSSSVARSEAPRSSSVAGDDELTDMTECSLPDSPPPPPGARRSSRTPFGRARTMFAGTPMDVEMASPSPAAIASLSLSPRRNGSTKTPTAPTGNIFARSGATPPAAPPRPASASGSDPESDSDACFVPSPTRLVRPPRSKNPFTARDRPVLGGGLRSRASAAALAAEPRPLSKIPSAAALPPAPDPGSSSPSAPCLGRKPSAADPPPRPAAKNTVRGRTLVELQQARAGGRPPLGENASPKRAPAWRAEPAGPEPVAVWDPERDEMPSPFLVRQRRIASRV